MNLSEHTPGAPLTGAGTGASDAPVHVEIPPTAPVGYDVIVEPDVLDRIPRILEKVAPSPAYAILVDGNIEASYGRPLLDRLLAAGLTARLAVVPPGEEHKNRETWAALTDELLGSGMGRDGCIVAVGGGVTGDVAGFVAATYMRGIAFVQVPTTLLAMVDASIGGKTGVDTPAGKNLVGAFHQPRAVVIDPNVLRTLPERELRAGLAETVKHGAIADAEYFDWIATAADAIFAREPAVLTRLVRRSVEIKASFVAADEREAGLREALNFGHTIGHALEALSDYTLPHGYAVAMGMVTEAALGEDIGVTRSGTAAELRRVLLSLGLPAAPPHGSRPEQIVAQCRMDKKARASRVRYTLIERIGAVSKDERGRCAVAVEDDAAVRTLGALLGAADPG